jgi:hypothetical protein
VIFYDICNYGQLVVFSSQVDANVGYWQLTASFLKLDYCDTIYISGFAPICDIL